MYNDIFKARFYVWGVGQTTKELWQYAADILKQINIVGYIDNNHWNEEYEGKMVYKPDILNDDKEASLIVINRFSNEIIAQIEHDFPWYSDKVYGDELIKRLYIFMRYAKCEDDGIGDFLSYIRGHRLKVISNKLLEAYENKTYPIEYDTDKKMYYIYHGKYKMYFSRKFQDKDRVNNYYKYLCAEQDCNSPHCYLDKDFTVSQNDIVVDAGGAEGVFALSVIDKVKKVYIFEPDTYWVEALHYTFEQFGEKVVIIPKAISDYKSESCITLDSAIPDSEEVNFIKMDIEGEEYHAILGAQRVINNSKNLKCAICTYHQEMTYDVLERWFSEKEFKVSHSNGYMWFETESFLYKAPVLRRGLIRATKVE